MDLAGALVTDVNAEYPVTALPQVTSHDGCLSAGYVFPRVEVVAGDIVTQTACFGTPRRAAVIGKTLAGLAVVVDRVDRAEVDMQTSIGEHFGDGREGAASTLGNT